MKIGSFFRNNKYSIFNLISILLMIGYLMVPIQYKSLELSMFVYSTVVILILLPGLIFRRDFNNKFDRTYSQFLKTIRNKNFNISLNLLEDLLSSETTSLNKMFLCQEGAFIYILNLDFQSAELMLERSSTFGTNIDTGALSIILEIVLHKNRIGAIEIYRSSSPQILKSRYISVIHDLLNSKQSIN